MQQAVYDTRGADPHTRIRCVERDTPVPGTGEVLIEMIAAPINPSDVLTITGQYGALPPLPAIGETKAWVAWLRSAMALPARAWARGC